MLFKALKAYRDAIDRNPDYLDRSTPVFQGRKVKHAVAEGLSEIERRAADGLATDQLKADRKLIYYLQRRLAGSCG